MGKRGWRQSGGVFQRVFEMFRESTQCSQGKGQNSADVTPKGCVHAQPGFPDFFSRTFFVYFYFFKKKKIFFFQNFFFHFFFFFYFSVLFFSFFTVIFFPVLFFPVLFFFFLSFTIHLFCVG